MTDEPDTPLPRWAKPPGRGWTVHSHSNVDVVWARGSGPPLCQNASGYWAPGETPPGVPPTILDVVELYLDPPPSQGAEALGILGKLTSPRPASPPPSEPPAPVADELELETPPAPLVAPTPVLDNTTARRRAVRYRARWAIALGAGAGAFGLVELVVHFVK